MKQGAEPEAHKVHINTWRIVHVQDILIWWNLCTGSRVDQSNSAFTAPGQRIRRSLYPLWRKQHTVLDWTLWMINSKCWWGCYVKALLITLNNIQCDCSTIRCSLHIIKSCDTLIPPFLSKWCFMRNKQTKKNPPIFGFPLSFSCCLWSRHINCKCQSHFHAVSVMLLQL